MAINWGQIMGGYLFIEGFLSITASQDQRVLSNIGRLGRMAIGVWLIDRY